MAVGAAGFAVDATVLTVMMQVGGWTAFAARLVSFPIASLATWGLNRKLTFESNRTRWSEYWRYLAVQCVGAATNFGVFAAVIVAMPTWRNFPVLPLMVGAGAGLAVNFAGARYWAFAAGSLE